MQFPSCSAWHVGSVWQAALPASRPPSLQYSPTSSSAWESQQTFEDKPVPLKAAGHLPSPVMEEQVS